MPGKLLERLAHRIHILEATGESCRLKESKQRLKIETSHESSKAGRGQENGPTGEYTISSTGCRTF